MNGPSGTSGSLDASERRKQAALPGTNSKYVATDTGFNTSGDSNRTVGSSAYAARIVPSTRISTVIGGKLPQPANVSSRCDPGHPGARQGGHPLGRRHRDGCPPFTTRVIFTSLVLKLSSCSSRPRRRRRGAPQRPPRRSRWLSLPRVEPRGIGSVTGRAAIWERALEEAPPSRGRRARPRTRHGHAPDGSHGADASEQQERRDPGDARAGARDDDVVCVRRALRRGRGRGKARFLTFASVTLPGARERSTWREA